MNENSCSPVGKIAQSTWQRERDRIQLLAAFIGAGLLFMLLPGTLLGVWNLFSISAQHSPTTVSPTWIQAHGHAQLFGWVGSFILGIGFYSTPRLPATTRFREGWLCFCLWSTGVTLRWLVGVYQWQWQALLPLSALLEFLTVLIFLILSFQGHHAHDRTASKTPATWAILVIGGTIGLLFAELANLFECAKLAIQGTNLVFPGNFNQAFLVLATWGCVVPIAWGFSAHWMPAFLGLPPTHNRFLLTGYLLSVFGVVTAFANFSIYSSILQMSGSACIVYALRLFEKPANSPKLTGVHPCFPFFIRAAYIWLLLAGLLAITAGTAPEAPGLIGASRHAVTVGFLATMILSVGPRILPAFWARGRLYSQWLMLVSLVLLTLGCALRVAGEIIAYQAGWDWAWKLLPISATLELLSLIAFAINLFGTLMQKSLMPPAPSS